MPLRHPIAAGLLASLAFAASADAAGPQVAVRVQERTLIVDGTTRADTIAFRISPANPTRVAVDGDGDGAAELRVRRDRFDRIVVLAGGGRDTVSVTGSAAFTEPITIEGGDGADTLGGARGAETFVGGAGDDVVEGGGGADIAFLGTGDDRFTWDPGDGSDVVEGQSGDDKLTFNGSDAAEHLDVSAAGRRVRLLRDVGAVEMDLAGIDRIRTNALGGADTFEASDLRDTGVEVLDTELAGAPGASAGDGQDDRIVLEGTGGGDRAELGGTARVATVDGLSASVRIRHADGDDALTVNTLGGDDTVDAASLGAGAPRLTVDAGPGGDDVLGGAGDDVLLGGAGDDLVDPNRGADVAFLGEQADTFRWDPGDGSDTVEGQAGRDTLELNGGAANERIAATANGPRVRVTRNVGAVELDLGRRRAARRQPARRRGHGQGRGPDRHEHGHDRRELRRGARRDRRRPADRLRGRQGHERSRQSRAERRQRHRQRDRPARGRADHAGGGRARQGLGERPGRRRHVRPDRARPGHDRVHLRAVDATGRRAVTVSRRRTGAADPARPPARDRA